MRRAIVKALLAALVVVTTSLAYRRPALAFSGFSWWASTDNFTTSQTQ
jgi:hypothetical protein